ncbi:MAG: type II secretion system F family protein [Gammaproteobacteria bacterium]
MPDYNYRAVDKNGHSVKGVLFAENEKSLDVQLKDIGHWLIDASILNKRNLPRKIKVSRTELIEFCTSMAALQGAGIGIVDAITTMVEETENIGFEHVLEDLSLNISAGNTLVSAMSKHPDVFPEQMRNLINAAEYSGNLTEAFRDAANHLAWTDQLIKDVKQVSLYPTIVLVVVGTFILLLFSFVVPKFADLLLSVNVSLPLVTQIVLNISDFTKEFWYVFFIVPYLLIKVVKLINQRSEKFAFAMDRLKLKLPVFGEVLHMLSLSRFSHNMAILTRSGVPILQSLQLCRDLVGNRVISRAIEDAEIAVNQGRVMSDVFKQYSVFPPMLLRMMVVGEETGTMEQSMLHISARYDDEIPRKIKKIMGLLEPMIMVFLIAVVGTVAMAIFMPLMKLLGSVG